MKRHAVLITVLCLVFSNVMAFETMKQREQREALQKQLELRFRDVNQKLEQLTGKSANIKEDSRNEFKNRMEELRKKQELASKKLGELGSASGQDWDRLSAETNAAIDDLNRMYDRISSLFKSI